jgi:DNA helicase-2/ATP-dependent DNA helicase PcrA
MKVNNIRNAKKVSPKVAQDFIPGDISDLQVGMEVEHNHFGLGKVLQIVGAAGNKKATIYFTKLGQKQILLRYAKMRIIR